MVLCWWVSLPITSLFADSIDSSVPVWWSSSTALDGCQHHLEAGSLIPFLESEILSFQPAQGFKRYINVDKGTGDASVRKRPDELSCWYSKPAAPVPVITINSPHHLSSKPTDGGGTQSCHLQHSSVLTTVSWEMRSPAPSHLSHMSFWRTNYPQQLLSSFRTVFWTEAFHRPRLPKAGFTSKTAKRCWSCVAVDI